MTKLFNAVSPVSAKNTSVTSEGGLDLPLVANTSQVARLLGVTTRHVANLTARGLIKATRLGRCVRYRRDAVLDALKNLEG
jgi:excisionase family DNA binding protein